MNIRELAAQLGATLENASGSEEIGHTATITEAGPGSVSFIANPAYEKFLLVTEATAVIIGTSLALPKESSGVKKMPAIIRSDDPYGAFAKTLALFNPRKIFLRAHSSDGSDQFFGEGAHRQVSARSVLSAMM